MDSDHIDSSTSRPFPVCVPSVRAEKCFLQRNSPLPDLLPPPPAPVFYLETKATIATRTSFPDKKAAVRGVSRGFSGTQMEGLTRMEKLWASQTFLPKSHPGVFTNHWLNGDSDFETKVGPLILPF